MFFYHLYGLNHRKNSKLKNMVIFNYCVNKKLLYNFIFRP